MHCKSYLSLQQAVKAHRVVRRRGSHIVYTDRWRWSRPLASVMHKFGSGNKPHRSVKALIRFTKQRDRHLHRPRDYKRRRKYDYDKHTNTSRKNLRSGIWAVSVHGQPCIIEIVCRLLRSIQFAFHFITLRSIFWNGHVSYQLTH
jgi:hypothetical protein